MTKTEKEERVAELQEEIQDCYRRMQESDECIDQELKWKERNRQWIRDAQKELRELNG